MPVPVPILLYHSVATRVIPPFKQWTVAPETFAAHMAYLRDHHYTPITVTQLAYAMLDHAHSLPSRPVVISFDDGLADFYSAALPVLREYGFVATLYLVTKYIGQTSRWMHREGADRLMLTWAQIGEISRAGIECGGHSHRHLQLDTLPLDLAQQEIVRSKWELESHLNCSVETFAYPYGYYSPAVRRLVEEAGFTSACAVKHALSATNDDRFALARIIISCDTTVDRLGALLVGQDLRTAPIGESVQTKSWRLLRRTHYLLAESQQ